jgi:hypothetical protein
MLLDYFDGDAVDKLVGLAVGGAVDKWARLLSGGAGGTDAGVGARGGAV